MFRQIAIGPDGTTFDGPRTGAILIAQEAAGRAAVRSFIAGVMVTTRAV